MSESLRAAFYADHAQQCRSEVVENAPLARDTYRVRIRCPEIARRITPGQFVMLRLAGANDPLLARPLALYDTWSEEGEVAGIDLVYLVLGRMTARLAGYQPGQALDVWGPLGNGFAPQPSPHLIMVAGGIGQTPFVALAAEALGLKQYGEPPRAVEPVGRVTFCYGARTADLLAGLDDFARLGVDVQIATDDGSRGHHGFVTDVLHDVLPEADADARIVCCGPEPMMEAVAEVAAYAGRRCEVSLETPMACGIGICFSCVAKVAEPDGGWDYKRTCVEGPVFQADRMVW
jgi:dihydroorotate dehydrogenase electron transfer subunit